MIAYEIQDWNLPLISSLNDGVTPKIENETTYFVHNPRGYNVIVTQKEFRQKYTILRHLDVVHGHHLVMKK